MGKDNASSYDEPYDGPGLTSRRSVGLTVASVGELMAAAKPLLWYSAGVPGADKSPRNNRPGLPELPKLKGFYS